MTQRKTIDRRLVLEEINQAIRDAKTEDQRLILRHVAERILHQSNTYRGFNWNYWMEKGFEEWKEDGEPDFPEKDQYIYGNRSKNDVCYF